MNIIIIIIIIIFKLCFLRYIRLSPLLALWLISISFVIIS
jgi:hypothetical protein